MCEKLLFTSFSPFICLDALFTAWTVYQALVFIKKKKKKKAENSPTLQTWMCYPNRAIVLINYQPRQISKNHCFLINYQLFEIVFERYGYFSTFLIYMGHGLNFQHMCKYMGCKYTSWGGPAGLGIHEGA